jgi:hypothetical protein
MVHAHDSQTDGLHLHETVVKQNRIKIMNYKLTLCYLFQDKVTISIGSVQRTNQNTTTKQEEFRNLVERLG